jgi:hypothetical protein
LPASTDVVAGWLRFQAHGCRELGSTLYAALLEHAADDLEAGGPVRQALEGFEGESGWSALALRLMGAVHRLVLTGRLPELARHYPSAGGDGDAEAAWPMFRAALAGHRDEVRTLVARPCQTNEVGRCAALIGGFLEVGRRTGLPLRILEIGASAGLNLRWDHYRYEAGRSSWGDAGSPVQFTGVFEVAPSLDRDVVVAERLGCDLDPIDPTSEDGSLTLRSFIWADQLDRFRRLEGAIEVARRVPAPVERLDALEFLRRELASPRPGVATVVYHSVFMQYLDEPARNELARTIESAPVSHLSMEPGESTFEVRLDGVLMGTAKAHGSGVRWLVS